MNVYDFKAIDIRGNEVSLRKYEGNVLLIVNSATQCGFTPQYDALQELYEKYKDKGFIILDFPCDQFNNQAPGTNEEIHNFCSLNYGITFPMFTKIEVNGENAHPLYKYLISQKGFKVFDNSHSITPKLKEILQEKDPNYENTPSIKWNFTKFLIDRNGNVVERFEPTDDMRLLEEKIKKLL